MDAEAAETQRVPTIGMDAAATATREETVNPPTAAPAAPTRPTKAPTPTAEAVPAPCLAVATNSAVSGSVRVDAAASPKAHPSQTCKVKRFTLSP